MQLEGTNRRLPIYVVIDTSGSMRGAPIDAVSTGLRELEAALKADAHALETAYVSVITFSDTAHQLMPLTEVGSFSAPELSTGSQTNLGAAIRLLVSAIDAETKEKDAQHPGDWKPLVFLLTDGRPTDNEVWPHELAAYKARRSYRPVNLIAIGCGPHVDSATLKELGGTTLMMPEMSPERFRSLFAWISQSVRVASRSASQQKASAAEIRTPDLPQGINISL